MRNKKIIVHFCTVLFLLMLTGCGNSNEGLDASTAGTINFNDVIETNTEENNSNHQSMKEEVDNQQDVQLQPDNGSSQVDNTQLQSDSELDGVIESIGNNCVVINKIFHTSENTSVSYVGLDSENTLITVYFSEETEFEVRTVKNNGVNGDADTEKRQGTFSDLMQDAVINMTGSYDGDDFHAKHVIIYQFV